jgi:hypothetical protein
MQKESQTQFVHRIGLGERQALSHETPKPLLQSVVPSLDMGSQAGLFAHCRMLLLGDDHLGDDLPGSTTQGNPDPAFVDAFSDE